VNWTNGKPSALQPIFSDTENPYALKNPTEKMFVMKKKLILLAILLLSIVYSCKNNRTNMTDRIEIQDLINTYAHCADNREAQKQAELFTENAVVNVFMGKEKQAVQTLHGRKELAEAFQALKQYDVTTHFNGQSIVSINGDTATNESYCLAHHIKYAEKTLLIMSIRYRDKLVKQNNKWLFAERDLFIDWTDSRELKQ
jgi:hypothetical protein